MCYDCVNKIIREAVDINNDNAIRTSGRDSVADALRGFAIILVVIGHVLGGFQNSKLLFPGVFALNDSQLVRHFQVTSRNT